jgi:HAD superfamily hydrolase (TIGR01509 family)
VRIPAARPLRALLFDFDHTLTDFGRGVDWRRAREEVVALYTAAGIDVASVRARGAFGLLAAMHDAVARLHSPARADEIRHAAFEILARHECAGAARASLLPGAARAIADAATAGLALGIVSANAESAIRAALGRLGVGDAFAAVVGRTPELALKTAPDMHHAALRRLGCEAAAALTVGDSVNDMRAGAAAGMLAVGVAGGESTAEELFAAGACYVLADLTALPTLLALWAGAADD